MNRRLASLVVLGWALLYSRGGKDWQVVDRFEYEVHCTQVLTGRVDQETVGEIGGALAGQPADNPLRQDAYRRAVRRVRDRYRCDREL